MNVHNNHIHSDSNKRRSFLALLFAAGDVRRYTDDQWGEVTIAKYDACFPVLQ